MKMLENPMVAPLTEREEWDMMSEEEIENLPKCSWCGEPVLRKFKNVYMHRNCWHEGKAEYDAERD